MVVRGKTGPRIPAKPGCPRKMEQRRGRKMFTGLALRQKINLCRCRTKRQGGGRRPQYKKSGGFFAGLKVVAGGERKVGICRGNASHGGGPQKNVGKKRRRGSVWGGAAGQRRLQKKKGLACPKGGERKRGGGEKGGGCVGGKGKHRAIAPKTAQMQKKGEMRKRQAKGRKHQAARGKSENNLLTPFNQKEKKKKKRKFRARRRTQGRSFHSKRKCCYFARKKSRKLATESL